MSSSGSSGSRKVGEAQSGARADLSDPGTLRAFIQKHGLSARKGLGQHFLCSSSAVRAIVSATVAAGTRGVLEIGPGPGVLTGPLSEVAETIALELDDRMIEALRESAPRARILKLDALEADFESLLADLPAPRGVVSNLPYYITGALLTRIASARHHFSRAVLMMQREVAQRITAPAGDSSRGSLSVFLQAQFAISKVASVPAGAFLPPPKVDSSVLLFEPNDTSDSPSLFEMVRVGFTQPRKTLANNLAAFRGAGREVAASAIVEMGLDARIRPQELSVEQWRNLFVKLDE
ncbi:MAG: 16S rRNA (adenine(1518)-N(6)/adenine(1519)-N(6))-dimethyltransferase RsmA [Fimbriimonadaceae bacterium]